MTTVLDWTVKLRAANICSFRSWLSDRYTQLFVPSAYDRALRVIVNRMRCDATNTVWKYCKMHVLEYETTWIGLPVTNATSVASVRDSTETRRTIASILPLRGTGSGPGLVGVIEAQFASIGVPLWREELTPSMSCCASACHADGAGLTDEVVIVDITITDDGSDIASWVGLMAVEVDPLPDRINMSIRCFAHQYHLNSGGRDWVLCGWADV